MLHSLVVGLGRCGAGLHVPAIHRARARHTPVPVFADAPVIGVDPARATPPEGLLLAGDLAHAAQLAPPDRTMVHVCTPPTVRAGIVESLARLGYRRMILEKPLATDPVAMAELDQVRRRWGLRLAVVSHWLTSALTARLREHLPATGDGPLGRLRSLAIVQRKPRFARSLRDTDHATAFDVELPHSVALALALAGPAELDDAGGRDLCVDGVVRPGLGAAWLALRHARGVRTTILSELTSPVRERRLTAHLTGGTLTGYFPCSDADPYAQLRVCTATGDREPDVFADDAFGTFLLRAYAGHPDIDDTYPLHRRVVELLHPSRVPAVAR